MHKIRNTKHLEVLNSLLGTTPHGCSGPLSKKSLWKLCIIKKWDKKKVLESIEDVYNQYPEFEKARIVERMVEPDRIYTFRVTWVDDRGEITVIGMKEFLG